MATRMLNIAIAEDLADMIDRRVGGGEFASAAELVENCLRTIDDDPALDAWVRQNASLRLEEMTADPSMVLNADQMRAGLARSYDRLRAEGVAIAH